MLNALIVGSGAIGCLYASKLPQKKVNINILCRSDYDYLLNNDITIIHPDRTTSQFKPAAILAKNSSNNTIFDYIIVCTKVIDIQETISTIEPFYYEGSTIVLIQNGITIEKPYIEAFSNSELISGLAFVCATKTKPGVIDHSDFGKLTLGNFPQGPSKKTQELANLFQEGGCDCNISQTIEKDRFIKLMWNIPFNPLSIISGGLNTQELLSNPSVNNRIRRLMEEVRQIAKAKKEGKAKVDKFKKDAKKKAKEMGKKLGKKFEKCMKKGGLEAWV